MQRRRPPAPRSSKPRRAGRPASALALLGAVLSAGCATPDRDDDGASVRPEEASADLPWTQAFQEEAVLVAERIRIEGPSDLLLHVAIRQDPERTFFEQTTTTDGLLQVVRSRQGVGPVQIRAQLDGWSLVAIQSLEVLQRPSPSVPVRLSAVGEAAWLPTGGGAETRAERLDFTGVRGGAAP